MLEVGMMNERKRYKCSRCTFEGRNFEVDFHVKNAHRGGEACPTCGNLFFRYKAKYAHKKEQNCSSPESIFVIVVFALPLTLKNRKNKLYIGYCSKKTALLGAEAQLATCAKAKKKNFVHNDKAIGCSSLTKPLYPKNPKKKYTAHPNQAFF